MRIEPRTYELNGHTLVLRSAEKADAVTMLPYLKRVCGETRFLLRDADECMELTIEQEEGFISSHTDNDRACLIVAELDGEYVGNAEFKPAGGSRRSAHRATVGIALYLAYTGMGIGKRLFSLLLETVAQCGYEAVELTVIEGNDRAIRMYESFGFIETGRIPKANKYDDGSYADDIIMVKALNTERNRKMFIETERLFITEFDLSMARVVHENSLDEDNRKFVPDEVFETEDEARETVAFLINQYDGEDGPLVYPILTKSGENIGYVQLVPIEEGWEIGYHVAKKYTGNGYATEAVTAFLPIIAEKKALSTVYGICLRENAASVRVMEKCGFENLYRGVGKYQGEDREIVRNIWRR